MNRQSYRRDGRKSRDWQEWREKHSAELAAAAVPAFALVDERALENPLFHGYDAVNAWSL